MKHDNMHGWTDKIIGYYDNLFDKYGNSPKAVDQRDREQMRLRFEILSGIGDLTNSSIADIGSGFSDLYLFLKEKGWKGKYTGFEMNKTFVNLACERFPEAEIIEGEFLSMPVLKKFDWVFLNGTLNIYFDGIEKFTYDVIKKMYEMSSQGVAFNLMTSYVDFRNDSLAYNEPERIFKFCKTLTKYVTLRHDYPLWEFTVYLYRKG